MSGTQELAVELLIDRATGGLDRDRQSRLDALLESRPELDDDAFEVAAAAIELAYTFPDQELPAALKQRVAAQAADYFETPETSAALPFPSATAESRAGDRGRWSGWLAAAACLALAVFGWWPDREVTVSTPNTALNLPRTVTARQARDNLMARAGDLLRLEWTATEDPAASAASGDVVWSTESQRGFMHFHGLPVNDPSTEQYQLWIFDAEQDERYPVDGGVFDVTSTDEVVEIHPKLPIGEPKLFAVTIEKPGGVVVSSRERLPLLAQVG